ncbi:MAG: competence protein ComEC [Pseudomonadales bacterium]|jgi:competence protein ComEC
MRVRMLAIIIGICVAAFAPFLPDRLLLLEVIGLGLCLLLSKYKPLFSIGGILCGFTWALLYGQLQLSYEIDEQSIAKEIQVYGRVVDIPALGLGRAAPSTSFILALDAPSTAVNNLRNIRLSWYSAPLIKAGQRWQLKVKLKPVSSLVNTGSFDYRRWALVNNIDAVGSVVNSSTAQLLVDTPARSVAGLRNGWLDLIRRSDVDVEIKPLLEALGVGYRKNFTAQHNMVLAATGTSHLMVISGLHIGLCAGFGWWLGVLMAHLTHIPIVRGWRNSIASSSALLMAIIYCAMAGSAVPTTRALLMLALVIVLKLNWRRFFAVDILLLVMLALLLLNPLFVLSASFWLSFTAVAMLVLVAEQRGQGSSWWQIVATQWWVFVGLIPVLAITGLPISLISPVVNLVAIPLVSIFVVPPILLVMLISFVSVSHALLMLTIASYPLAKLWRALEYVQSLELMTPISLTPNLMTIALAIIGLGLLLTKTGFRWRMAGLLMITTIWLPVRVHPDYQLKLTTLDVGQGLSLVVQTQNHTLVYDMGASYESGFNLGQAVVEPYLRSEGVVIIDVAVVSHTDNDHAGGYQYLNDNFVIKKTYMPAAKIGASAQQKCQAGHSWIWDGVKLEFLHPFETLAAKTNNQSCVLQITAADQRLLLTGDIEREVEHKLVGRTIDELASDVLIAPHHGSSSSSSALFLHKVKPKTVIVSAGYLNRFNHPTAEVLSRYKDFNSLVLNTAQVGSVELLVGHNGKLNSPRLGRSKMARYWRRYPCHIDRLQQDLSALEQWIYSQRCDL